MNIYNKDTVKCRVRRRFGSFLSDTAGAIIIAFAVMLPVLVGSVGMSMDLAESYLVRQRLGGTVDAAALAATASETDPDQIAARVQEFFQANYPDTKLGTTHDLTTTVNTDDDTVTVSAYADYNTTFMKVLGIDKLTVFRTTTVKREIQGLEVVMVLDNTGSMSDADKIDALKTASTNLVNILFQKTDDPSHVKIGMVPYANSVRVGRYGIGLNPDGTPFENPDGTQATPFVTLPSGISYTTSLSSSSGWYGCVVEHNPGDPQDTDTTMVSNSRGQLWTSSEHPYAAHGWDPSSTTNDDYPQDVTDDYEGPWDIYSYGTVSQQQSCSQYNCHYYHCSQNSCQAYQCTQEGCQTYQCQKYYTSGRNKGQCQTYYSDLAHCDTFYTDGDTNNSHCATVNTSSCNSYYTDGDSNSSHCASYYNSTPPDSNCKTWYSGTPINSTTCQTYGPTTYTYSANSQPNRYCPYANLQPLTSDQDLLLSDIQTMTPNGDTRGDIGIMWGYRVISPEAPFTQAADWTDKNWRKAVIMMTDGMNTKDGTYAGDWFGSKNQLGVSDYNERFSEVCQKLKDQGVTVYTIILGTDGQYSEPDQATKDIYKACASDSTKYFDSESNQALIDAFTNMANQLANLHISK